LEVPPVLLRSTKVESKIEDEAAPERRNVIVVTLKRKLWLTETNNVRAHHGSLTSEEMKKIADAKSIAKKHRNQSVTTIHITELIDVVTPPPNPSGDAHDRHVDGMTAIKTADFQYLRAIEGGITNLRF
jgi:hypothetical protein